MRAPGSCCAQALNVGSRHRTARLGDVAEAAEVEGGQVAARQQERERGRYSGESRDALIGHALQDRVRIRDRILQQQLGAGCKMHVQYRVAVGKLERQHGDTAIVRPQSQVLHDRCRVGRQIAVTQHDALGTAGRSGRVDDCGQRIAGGLSPPM